MTNYSTKPTPLSDDLDRKKVLIASTLDEGRTQFTGTIDYVGQVNFDFNPDKFTGTLEDLDRREWEVFLEEEPLPDQPGVYESINGTIYILAGDKNWYHFNRYGGGSHLVTTSFPSALTLVHPFNLFT